MSEEKNFTVRKVQRSDIARLKTFFIEAYGEDTIFQYEPFLEWYFNPQQEKHDFMKDCIVGVSTAGQIVSHYGGLNYSLLIGERILPLIWGVNAFTLQEWRGKGINSEIVEYINENYEVNGVIGFSEKTASFYDKIGYNIFNFERFSRYIHILDRLKTKEVLRHLGQDADRFAEFDTLPGDYKGSISQKSIIRVDKNNLKDFNIELGVHVFATTQRDKKFIDWRLLQSPFIDYKVYGWIENKTIIAYIACREEVLHPLNHTVNRIIDLYGDPKAIPDLLDFTIQRSTFNQHIYIDFSMFGILNDETLLSCNFLKLEGEDLAILPQVTAPVTYRPNIEHIGFQSRKYKTEIDLMKKENVYFTRIDSDRDRLARYSQIGNETSKGN